MQFLPTKKRCVPHFSGIDWHRVILTHSVYPPTFYQRKINEKLHQTTPNGCAFRWLRNKNRIAHGGVSDQFVSKKAGYRATLSPNNKAPIYAKHHQHYTLWIILPIVDGKEGINEIKQSHNTAHYPYIHHKRQR